MVRKKKKGAKEPNPLSVKKKKKMGGTHSEGADGKEISKGIGNDENGEENVIGEVTESSRRQKSTRKRKHHKRSSKAKDEFIPEE